VQQTRVLFERSAGGAGRLRAMWLQQYAIGPGQIQQMVRYQLLMDKLSQQLGADRSTPGGQEKVLAALRDASASLGISVNPRYGAWDSERVVLDTVQEPWLRANPARAEQPAY
jgi:hypothetical protein